METKQCASCKQTLCVTEFEFKDKKNNRRSSWCKQCMRAYKKRHYSENKDRYLQVATICNYKRRHQLRLEVWKYLSQHPCVDCGEHDPVALEFDHRDPATKIDTVSHMVTKMRPLSDILAEIAKCDVRCANCHRKRTAKQFCWHEDPSLIVRLPRRKRRNAKKELQNEQPDIGGLSQ